ncbi:MAG: hypothetical protein RLZZ540_2929 [Bacteroidota bacterium]|jgi:hypothetical protein
MKKLNIKNPLFVLIVLFFTLGIVFSCTNNDTSSTSNSVELLSFGPSGQLHGQPIVFVGKNLDRVTSIKLEGAEVIKANFVSQSAEKIEIIIPKETLEGKVTLVYDEGEVISKTVLSFDVPFKVINFTTEAKPGANITITGEYLNWVKSVVFNSGIVVTEFVSVTANKLVVKVPFDAKTGPITINGGGTEPYEYISEKDLIVTLPVVNSIDPLSVKHSDLLTITGVDLDLVKSITFPNSAASIAFVSQSATKIEVKVPNTATDGKLTLTVFSGLTVQSSQSIKIILPSITSVAPTPVQIGADWTINGANLDLVKEIIIPGVVTPITVFVSKSASKIVVKVPVGAFSGAIKLKTINDFLIVTTTKIDIAGLTDIPLQRVIYDDTFKNGFGNWSWGGPSNPAYTAEVKEGTKSFRKDYVDNDGLRFGGGKVSTSGMSELVFSIYGGVGLENNQNLSVMINGAWSVTTVKVKIGLWTEYVLPLSSLPILSSAIEINDLAFQGKGGYVIIDKVGLR